MVRLSKLERRSRRESFIGSGYHRRGRICSAHPLCSGHSQQALAHAEPGQGQTTISFLSVCFCSPRQLRQRVRQKCSIYKASRLG